MSTSQKKRSAEALVQLSPADLRRLPKPRAGFERFAPQLVALVKAKPELLRIKGFDAAGTLAELRAYEALQPVIASAKRQLAMARETRMVHAANVWRTMLKIYQHAQASADDDPEIADVIEAMEAFMKLRRRKPASPVPPSSTPVAA